MKVMQECPVVSMRTGSSVVAGLVHLALEELQAHDGIDGDQ